MKLAKAEKLLAEKMLTFDSLSELHSYEFIADGDARAKLTSLLEALMAGMSTQCKRKAGTIKESKKATD